MGAAQGLGRIRLAANDFRTVGLGSEKRLGARVGGSSLGGSPLGRRPRRPGRGTGGSRFSSVRRWLLGRVHGSVKARGSMRPHGRERRCTHSPLRDARTSRLNFSSVGQPLDAVESRAQIVLRTPKNRYGRHSRKSGLPHQPRDEDFWIVRYKFRGVGVDPPPGRRASETHRQQNPSARIRVVRPVRLALKAHRSEDSGS